MRITKMEKSVAGCLFVITSFLLLTVSVLGTEQELKTLKLMKTYQSESEFQNVNASILRAKRPIMIDEESIEFIDSETGQVLKKLKKETQFDQIQITETERIKLSHPSRPETIIKECTGYYLPPQAPSFLLVLKYKITIPPSDESSPSEKIQKATIYDHRGEQVMILPSDANTLAPSPDQKYFILYYEGMESVGEYLYFYRADGTLITKQKFTHASLKINFSTTGEFIAIHSHWGKQFFIFTKQGEIIFEGNYQDYSGKNSTLEDVFVSDDGNYILLSISNKAILLNGQGDKLWEIQLPVSPIENVYFHLAKNYLLMFRMAPDTIYNDDDSRGLRVVSVDTGEILDEIADITYYTIANNILYVKQQEGSYYEYKIK